MRRLLRILGIILGLLARLIVITCALAAATQQSTVAHLYAESGYRPRRRTSIQDHVL